MRILVIADIHSNSRALKAVLDKFGTSDEIWCLGDIVEYGPSPSECISLVKESCTKVVRGNHDESTGRYDPGSGGRGWASYDGEAVSPEERRYLLSLPDTLSVSIGEESFLLLHGSPGNPNSGALWPHTDHADLQNEISEVRERHILCGHTHMAMNLEAGSHRILNPGTIGQPRDGDYRAQCLLIDDGDYFFERVEYDLDALEYDYKNSTIPEDVQETWTRYTRKGIVEVHGLQLGPFSARPRPTELK